MKKVLLLFLTLCCLCGTAWAADTHYVNEKYGFSLLIPQEFKSSSFEAPFALGAYTNEKIFLQLRYITPQAGYSGTNFGNVTKKEIDDFIKRQRFVAAINTNKFSYLQHDTHVTANNFPYLWAMFVSDMPMGGQHFRTFLLKNYFFNKDIIIEMDFIIPEDEMKNSTSTINNIVNSMAFKNPALTNK